MTVTIDGTSGINTPGVVNTAAETIATTLAVTGVTTVQAGTAALPAITTTGDTNTGIFFPAADTIAFSEGGAEAVRIDSSGNVGIGTSSPIVRLHVNGTNDQYIRVSSSTYSNFVQTFAGNGSTGVEYKSIYRFVDTDAGERARIDSSGNLLINTTSQLSAGKVSLLFDGAANQAFVLKTTYASTGSNFFSMLNSSGSQIGSITNTSGSTISYNTSSDYRLKNTIAPMTGALAKVALLKPCTYKWNADGSDGQGFIAHELDEVVQGCVTGEKDAVETVEIKDEEGNVTGTEQRPVYQGIDTSFLVATLTAAIQEQQTLITALTTRITALEGAAA